MTGTEFRNVAFLWGWWTSFETVWIAVPWQTRTRVWGGGVYRLPGRRHIRRGAAERRVGTLLAALGRKGVPAQDRPKKERLVDRWHRIVVGRCVPVLLQKSPSWWPCPLLVGRSCPAGPR
ncbi:hypothetical protein SUDANB58_04521 [Streptomyces sp. enrichment culture]|uniref:hypothetical protein n=1 Tax=Streptomyces sp. enrichment culture TaxID=1795815 RepID=UPI003F5639D6